MGEVFHQSESSIIVYKLADHPQNELYSDVHYLSKSQFMFFYF